MKLNRYRSSCSGGFSLLEVMIALGIFFMAVFAILGVITNGLRNARTLQRKTPDAGMVASEIALSNSIVEQPESGQFGPPYAGFSWVRNPFEVASNKLFQVDITIQQDGKGGEPVSKMSILLFGPYSPPGSLDGGVMAR